MRLGRRFRNEETGAAVTTASTLPKSPFGRLPLSADPSVASALLALLLLAIGSSSWASLVLMAFSGSSLFSSIVADESASDFLADSPENRLRRSVRLTCVRTVLGRSLTGSETRFLKRFNPADLDVVVVVVVASVTTTFSAAGSTTSTASPSAFSGVSLVASVSDTVSLVLDSSTAAKGAVSVVVVELKRPRFRTDDMGRGDTILLVCCPAGLGLTAGSEAFGSCDATEDSAGLPISV